MYKATSKWLGEWAFNVNYKEVGKSLITFTKGYTLNLDVTTTKHAHVGIRIYHHKLGGNYYNISHGM